MQEAKYSFNIRFSLEGYDCQFTLREDQEDAAHLMRLGIAAVKWLGDHGAQPERRWESVKNGQPLKTNGKGEPLFPQPPVCKVCGTSNFMELIEWEKDGKPRKAWKCQNCQKWASNGK